MPVGAPPARAVRPRGLVDLGGQREQAREEDDDPEPELLPDDHADQRRQRVVGVAEPVAREAAESDLLERRVEQAVQRQDLPEEHADDRDGQEVGDEDHPPVEAPAAHPLVEQDRDQQRGRDDQRQPERDQLEVVVDDLAEERILEDDAQVAEPDVGAVAMQRLLEQAVDPVREDEHDDGERGRDPGERLECSGEPTGAPRPARRPRRGHTGRASGYFAPQALKLSISLGLVSRMRAMFDSIAAAACVAVILPASRSCTPLKLPFWSSSNGMKFSR